MRFYIKRGRLGFYLSLVLFLTAAWQCKNPTAKTDEKHAQVAQSDDSVAGLRKTVMTLHDATMANMDTIVRLKTYLKKELAGDIEDAAVKDSVETNLKRLAEAHDIMMDWMHQYQEPDLKETRDQKMAYFREQLQKIQGVKAKMNESIQLAANTLKKP